PPPGLVPSCAEGGVLGVLPGIVGSMQALEAIKLILGAGEPLIGRLLLFDALQFGIRELKLKKNPGCPVCGNHPTITRLIDSEEFCGMKPENGAGTGAETSIPPRELRQLLDKGEDLLVVDVREPFEYSICNIGGLLIPLNSLKSRIDEID